MNQILTPGQTVHTESGAPCKVERFLGGGGQGEVYKADLAGTAIALKWYFPAQATPDQRAALAGRVSMDMLSVDLRKVPRAEVGDAVELWGENVSATEVAKRAGTISYELLTGVTSRVPRRVDNAVG